jgi:hypothetical protein
MGVYDYGMNLFTPKIRATMRHLVLQRVKYHGNKEKHGRGDEGNTSTTHGFTCWVLNG